MVRYRLSLPKLAFSIIMLERIMKIGALTKNCRQHCVGCFFICVGSIVTVGMKKNGTTTPNRKVFRETGGSRHFTSLATVCLRHLDG